MLYLTFSTTVDCDGRFTSPIALYLNPDLGLHGDAHIVPESLIQTLALGHGDYVDSVRHLGDDEGRLRHMAGDPERDHLFCPVYVIDTRDDVTDAIFGELSQTLYLTDEGFHISAEGEIINTDLARFPMEDVATLDEALAILRRRRDV